MSDGNCLKKKKKKRRNVEHISLRDIRILFIVYIL